MEKPAQIDLFENNTRPLSFFETNNDWGELTLEERNMLKEIYKERVGVPIRIGFSDLDLKNGIKNPENEQERIRALDSIDDAIETERTYRR